MVSCRKKVENLLKTNGKMYPSDISLKVGCSYSNVLKVLNEFERLGYVAKSR